MPLGISLPAIDVIHPQSLEEEAETGETYAALVRGSYMVKEIDSRGNEGKVIQERPGTNRVQGWSYYVDKAGRSKVF